MIMSDFIQYRYFHEPERMLAYTGLLDANGIEYEVAENRSSLDALYAGNQPQRIFFLKLKQVDFPRVDELLQSESERELHATESDDHYLNGFTDDELVEILARPDEWTAFDFQLAQQILKGRGKEFDQETLGNLKQKRISEMAKPVKASGRLIFVGYLLALAGGFLGALVGLTLMITRKTLPTGDVVYVYTKRDREQGSRIFVLGLIVFVMVILNSVFNTGLI